MKHSKSAKTIALLLAAIPCVGSLTSMTTMAAENKVDEAYENKKAAYRAQLMADDVTSDDFLIGSWVSFFSFDTMSYEDQLDQMAAAGINFNIFPKNFGSYSMYDAAYWDDVEVQYAKRNMLYLMGGDMNPENVSIGLAYADGKEHCIGYHVKDEPRGDMLAEVAQIVKLYRESDTVRYPLVNLFPSYAGREALVGSSMTRDFYREHVSNFVALAGAENIEYLSHDYYVFQAFGEKKGIFSDMEAIRSVAYENGKLKTHAFPQSSSWAGMRMPNIDEMRWNVYAYLTYGFKALSWFNLVCPGSSDTEGEGFYDSLIYRDGTIRDPELFAAWSDLNWEIRGLSDILMNVDAAHAYHTVASKSEPYVEMLPEDYFIQLEGDHNFIISVMEPKEGTDSYVMLFNNDISEEVTAQFTVDSLEGVKWVEYFDPFIGEHVPMMLDDGLLVDSFLPGEGKLYRLRYDAYVEAPETSVVTDPVEEPTDEPTDTDPIEDDEKDNSSKTGGFVAAGVGVVALLGALIAVLTRKGKKNKAE